MKLSTENTVDSYAIMRILQMQKLIRVRMETTDPRARKLLRRKINSIKSNLKAV